MTDVLDLAQKFLVYGTLNSILAFGVIKTVKSSIQKKPVTDDAPASDIPVWLKLLLTYLVAGAWYPMIGDFNWYTKLIQCVIVGTISVAVYESAVKSVLDLVPTVFEAIKNKILPNK